MSKITPQLKLTILFLLLIAMIFISFLLGRFPLSASDVVSVFGGWMGIAPEARSASHVVMDLRFPRIIGAVLVGAALSVSGAAYQVMFRNPMVSPAILGVSAGAAFGTALAILWSIPAFFVHTITFFGGMCAVTYVIGAKLCRGGSFALRDHRAGWADCAASRVLYLGTGFPISPARFGTDGGTFPACLG